MIQEILQQQINQADQMLQAIVAGGGPDAIETPKYKKFLRDKERLEAKLAELQAAAQNN